MSIQFPDVSQYTPVSLAGAPVALARATIGTVKDSHFDAFVADAATHQVPLIPYCFLNAESLGVSPEAQADYAYSVVGTRPVMLDHEPNRGACATIGEACRWIDRFRYRGGTVRLHYLPKWAWSGTMGSPSLQPLADRRMALVASNYTSYSDNGPGWQPYYPGCPVDVVQWQFSDSWPFGGGSVDWNAYRGTVTDYLTTAGGIMSDADIPDTHRLAGNGDQWGNATVTGQAAHFYGSDGKLYPTDNVLHQKLDAIRVAAQTAAAAVTQPVAVTQDQINTAVLQALSNPTVVQNIAAAVASHIHVT